MRIFPLFAAMALASIATGVALRVLPGMSVVAVAAAIPVRTAARTLRAAGGDARRMLPAIRATIAVHGFVGAVLILAALLG